MPLSPEQLDEIEKRANAAAKGPWVMGGCNRHLNDRKAACYAIRDGVTGGRIEGLENMALMASCRQDIPALIADLRAANARCAAMEKVCSEALIYVDNTNVGNSRSFRDAVAAYRAGGAA